MADNTEMEAQVAVQETSDVDMDEAEKNTGEEAPKQNGDAEGEGEKTEEKKEETDEAKKEEAMETEDKETDKSKEEDKKKVEKIPDNARCPPKQTYNIERRRDMRNRTLLVWPVTAADLGDAKLQELLQECLHSIVRFYDYDEAKQSTEGHIELRYVTIELALAAIERWQEVKEGIQVKQLNPDESLEKAYHAMKGSSKDPKVGVEYRTVFVGTLPTTVNEDALRATFPDAVSVLIPRDENQANKGYGYVEYETLEETKEAVTKYSETEIEGQKLTIRKLILAEPPSREGADKLPPGALHETKWKTLVEEMSKIKERMKATPNINQQYNQKRAMKNIYRLLKTDVKVRKECGLPIPTGIPEDPDLDMSSSKRPTQSSARGRPPMNKRRRMDYEPPAPWRGASPRGGRNWGGPPRLLDMQPRADAANLLMGLTHMLSNQSPMGGGMRRRGGARGGAMYAGAEGPGSYGGGYSQPPYGGGYGDNSWGGGYNWDKSGSSSFRARSGKQRGRGRRGKF